MIRADLRGLEVNGWVSLPKWHTRCFWWLSSLSYPDIFKVPECILLSLKSQDLQKPQVWWFGVFLYFGFFSFACFSRCCTNLSLEQSSPLPADLLCILSDMSRSLCPPGSPLSRSAFLTTNSSAPGAACAYPRIVLTALDCNQFVSFTDKAVNYWRSGAMSDHLCIPKT